MTADERSVSQLEQELDALSAEIERMEDRGLSVMPEHRTRLIGLTKLLAARRKADGAETIR